MALFRLVADTQQAIAALMQLGVLGLTFRQEGDVGNGFFPEHEKTRMG
jgi:hypothetical protein